MDNKLRRLTQPRHHFYFIVFLIFSIACAYISIQISVAGILLCALCYGVYLHQEKRRRREMVRYMQAMPMDIGGTTSRAITEIPMPTLVAEAASGTILWTNDAFGEAVGRSDCALTTKLSELAPDFNTRWLAEGKPQFPGEVRIDKNYFWVYGSLMTEKDGGEVLLVLYFVRCTDFVHIRSKYSNTRPVVSIIAIDNYEELTKGATDSEKAVILAEIDKKLGQWTRDNRSLLRKYDRDKYIFVLESGDLGKLIAQKFSVLDDVRSIQSRAGVVATLSIGVGKDGETYDECFRFASVALDMALSRGGDQAVVKTKYNFEFFGGLSKELEKRTKVKSRVVANALMQLINDSSQVMIMGHQSSDMDAIGAAVGMACAVRCHNRPVYIVVQKERTLAGDLIKKLEATDDYNDVFIEPDEAMVRCDFNTLLIVVDTNRPDYVESLPLLESINKVAVIDHHRRAASYIENFALNLHEPYASSTCELVSELLQYMVQTSEIHREEAECLLAGIYLDTKGFSVKTGVRTFEAAAYLKRAGAEMVQVKRLFQSTFSEYMVCQRIISTARDCGGGIILAISDTSADRIMAAQAADNLLNIIGVRASIVAFPVGEDTIVSARSFGQVNVQIIMEKLGGGGNINSAGAQLRDTPLEQAERQIVDAVDQYLTESDRSQPNGTHNS